MLLGLILGCTTIAILLFFEEIVTNPLLLIKFGTFCWFYFIIIIKKNLWGVFYVQTSLLKNSILLITIRKLI
jgi:hypothetical protein